MTKTRPTGPRDPVTGPDTGPESPFPIKLHGPVIKGFGRGSRELGIPTANIPPSGLSTYPNLESGVYFGFVGLRLSKETTQPADNSKLTLSASAFSPATSNSVTAGTEQRHEVQDDHVGVYDAVLSIGYNPFYNNSTRSIEIHILSHFPHYNFYGSPLNLLVLGFIRPEYDYKSLDDLVTDIKEDCNVAKRSLEREAYVSWREGEKWLRDFGWAVDVDVKRAEEEVLKKGGDGDGDGEEKGQKL